MQDSTPPPAKRAVSNTPSDEDDSTGDDKFESIYIPPIDVDELPDFDGMSHDQNATDYASFSEQFTEQINASEMLYPGSSVTKLQAISMLTSWFALHPGISKTAFNRLLHLLHTHILPTGNTLPKRYHDAHNHLKNLLTPTVEYHCCINDCIVYRDSESGNYAQLNEYPKCHEPRYKSGTDKIPRKRFIHLPLETRLRQIFSQSVTSQLIQQHRSEAYTQTSTSPTVVHNLHESRAWKQWYGQDGIYDGDERGVMFGLCTDGLNPFSKEKVTYSMWPIIVFPVNFPTHVRKLSSSKMLAGIIPGPKEPQNINPYLEVVADDMASLNGVEMYDGMTKDVFTLKANLLLYVLDYPGQNKVFHCQGMSTII